MSSRTAVASRPVFDEAVPADRAAASCPVLRDAETAAAAVGSARADVARIMLFGSVARGQATHCSDIDLVVLIDDLGDYRRRDEIKDQLTDAAQAAVGHPVHIHLSDLPEWRARTEKVSASFEASLTGQLLPLLSRGPRRPPDWGKPMTMPDNNLAEAASPHRDMARHLRKLVGAMTPDESEQQAWDPDVRDVYLKDRRRAACGHASDTIELAVKTVIALSGFPPSRTHNLRVLLGEVRSEAWRRELTEIVEASGLGVQDVLAWHALSAYTTDEGKQWRKAEADLTAMVQLAHDAALYADGVFMAEGGDPAPSRMVHEQIARLRRLPPFF